ncbi:cupin domain-containing protein [Streptomyces sp. 4N509B]|uniref:cupin domain-containing protein n=1 Tax=Streptomyces sp. 4N509B TaxID=3457413 RepID=UPI003FD0884C
MDALTSLLEGPRARGAFLLRAVLDAPWGLRVEDGAPLTVIAVARGETWIAPDDGQPVRLRAGDVGVMRGPAPYTAGDLPGAEPRAVVVPGGCAMSPDRRVDLCEVMELGPRTWGTSLKGSTVLLVGSYQMPQAVSRRLLGALPPLLALRENEWESALTGLMERQIARDDPGQDVVLDRMLDLLLISVLRAWFARPGTEAPAWYRAQSDPVVGRALRLMHEQPAHPWTVASLAVRAGVSRAALARRFGALVGEPPMAYLTAQRLALAAELLREPDATLDAVARRVGYGSGFALSAAFKRERGVSPRAYREGATAAVAVGTAGAGSTGPA